MNLFWSCKCNYCQMERIRMWGQKENGHKINELKSIYFLNGNQCQQNWKWDSKVMEKHIWCAIYFVYIYYFIIFWNSILTWSGLVSEAKEDVGDRHWLCCEFRHLSKCDILLVISKIYKVIKVIAFCMPAWEYGKFKKFLQTERNIKYKLR